MNLIKWFKKTKFDEECRSVGNQAIEICMQHGYNDFAVVGFRCVGDHMVPCVYALTPEQNQRIKWVVNS